MARVTVSEVREIITTSILDASLTVFITQANLFVTANLGGEGLSDDLLKEIERNIAAHFIHAADPRTTEEKIGDAAEKYSGEFATGLSATSYGQNAMMLDTTGILATVGIKRKRASIGIINYSVTQ